MEKYLIILMEVGIVVLSVKYTFNKDKPPTISLVKQSPKIQADCICANLHPLERDEKPSFWAAKDNTI